MRRKSLCQAVSLLTVAAMLAGCDNTFAANDSISKVNGLTEAQAARMAQMQKGGVFVEKAPYYGKEVRVAQGPVHGKPLPRQYQGVHGFSVAFSGADMAMISSEITKQTGIPVNIRTRYTLPDGKLVEIPIGSRLTLSHSGSLSRFLDLVADRMDVGWTYDGTAITFDRMVTKTYALPIPTTSSKFTTSIAGVTGTQSGASRSASLTTQSTEDPWGELKSALGPVTPSPAYANFQPDIGRVTIFGPPSVQAQAASVIDDFNATFSARIGLQIGVFWVK
ncbi:MAG: secretion protein, partial [Paracoccaceae bacterium]|nr:secretion protein [Paracoccaceae bacterium]